MNSVFDREVLAIDVATVYNVLCSTTEGSNGIVHSVGPVANTYYQIFPTDKLILRILVISLFLVDVAQTVTLTMHGWYFAVTTWGDPTWWDILPWTAAMIPIPCGLISATVQIFYSWRIWILTSNRFLRAMSILIVVLALAQGFAAIVPGVMLLHPPTQENLLRLHPGFSIWLSGSFVVDTLITACMTYIVNSLANPSTSETNSRHIQLTQAKQTGVWAPTETLLTKLIHRVIQTGAASSICAAIDLAMFVGFPSTNYHVVPYTNSLMLNLNLRRPTAPNTSQTPDSELNSFRINDSGGTGGRGLAFRISRTVDTSSSLPGIWTQKVEFFHMRFH
ncbi:hypothetical protein DFH09DRAFT_1098239 [Mycena vulgaris]|nr:hypothetical protein DFH09DRAFT_1098239 [Mycena vulgaris]